MTKSNKHNQIQHVLLHIFTAKNFTQLTPSQLNHSVQAASIDNVSILASSAGNRLWEATSSSYALEKNNYIIHYYIIKNFVYKRWRLYIINLIQ